MPLFKLSWTKLYGIRTVVHDAFAVVSQHQSMRHSAKLEVTTTLLNSECSELYLVVLGFFLGKSNYK